MFRKLLCKIGYHSQELVRIGQKAVWRCPDCHHIHFISPLDEGI